MNDIIKNQTSYTGETINKIPLTTTCEEPATCPWCGLYHIGVCSLVESIEFFSNGQLKKIKFRYQAMHWEAFLLPRSII